MIKRIFKKNQYFFILLIVLFLLTLVRMIDWLIWTPPSPGVERQILLNHFFEFFSGIPIIVLLIFSYKMALKQKSKLFIVVFIIFYSCFGMILVKYIGYGLKYLMWKEGATVLTKELLILYSPGGFLFFIILSAAFYLTYFWKQFIAQKEATHKAEILAKDAQLKMLRYQINPHFLFNTLNSLHALIDEDKNKGKELIISMSEYYRYTLSNQLQSSSIEMEVDAIGKYLEIQKIRFEEKFVYELSIDNSLYAFQVPSFIILLLIENAIKFGVKSNAPKLEIKCNAKKVNNAAIISVINNGRIIKQNKLENGDGTNTGIENIKNRLYLFYGNDYSFSLNETNGFVEAVITINNIATYEHNKGSNH